MDIWIAALLIGAGIFAGILNAIAGGASLVTFPALLAAGLSPIVANASNALAVMPGNVIAAIADRKRFPRRGKRLAALIAISLAGGLAGALLLLASGERLFSHLVPFLIGASTLLYALAPALQSMARAKISAKAPPSGGGAPGGAGGAFAWAMVPACIYGGYFGAGLGIILMMLFTFLGVEDVRQANALKNLSSVCCGLAAVAIFIAEGVISWPETLLMFSGALVGGHAGARLISVLPASILRLVVIIAGSVLSAVYALRYWFDFP